MRPPKRTPLAAIFLGLLVLSTVLVILASADSITIPKYRITDLGHLQGGYASYAKGINNSGNITGSDYMNFGQVSGPRAFLHDGKQIHDLGTLGGKVSSAWGINDLGQIVGDATTAPDPYFTRYAFFYDGTMHDLGAGGSSRALGINNRGQIVGIASDHAFEYDGTIHDLGTLGGTFSQAQGINNSGQVVGYSSLPGSSTLHAFLYDGQMHDLGTLGGNSSFAQAINNQGVVVGASQVPDGPNHAFLYDGSMHDLGAFDNGSTFAQGVNDKNQVVGAWTTSGTSPTGIGTFLYEKGTLYDLKNLLDSTGDGWAYFIEATGINNS